MNLMLRIGIYVPVLFLIAIVITGQHHATVQATVQAAVARTVRWLVWSAVLVASMLLLEIVFIGW